MTVRRTLALISAVIALATGLVGCSDNTPGNALPGTETTNGRPTNEPTRTTSSTKPGAGGSPLAETKPCSLLTSAGATQLGISGEGEERKVGSARTCRWRLRGSTGAEDFTVGISIYDSQGIDDLPGNVDKKPVPKIGSHEAVQSIGSTGGCAIIIAVSKSSRVETPVVGGNTQKACELAMKLATAVEPELP